MGRINEVLIVVVAFAATVIVGVANCRPEPPEPLASVRVMNPMSIHELAGGLKMTCPVDELCERNEDRLVAQYFDWCDAHPSATICWEDGNPYQRIGEPPVAMVCDLLQKDWWLRVPCRCLPAGALSGDNLWLNACR